MIRKEKNLGEEKEDNFFSLFGAIKMALKELHFLVQQKVMITLWEEKAEGK